MGFEMIEPRRLPSKGDAEFLALPMDDLVPPVPHECRVWTREIEWELAQPIAQARPRTEPPDRLRLSMSPRDELDWKREQGRSAGLSHSGIQRHLIMLHGLSTIPACHAGGPRVGDATCRSPVHREMAASDAQHVKQEDVEKSAHRDEPGQDTETCPCRKGISWDSNPACSTTISRRSPKLALILTGVSTTGAVLMAQWRLEYTSEWSDRLQSHFAKPELLSHPGVLVLGISLHCAALVLLYHLNGGDKRQDAFLVPITGAAAVLASLLGLELSAIILRATPWANIIALYASSYGKWS